MSNTCIKVHDITFLYEKKIIFEHFNAVFKTGQKTAIMAPSGSGKTTLLMLLSGLLLPQSGSIEYPFTVPKVSMVFQEDRLLERQSLLCNMQFVNPKLTADQVSDMLRLAGLKYLLTRKVCDLSGGEKRRVAILRALMAEYDILLLDEPFTGLDEETKDQIIELIKEQTIGKTVILVTHDKAEADALGCEISHCI